jgi:hypothetical protein
VPQLISDGASGVPLCAESGNGQPGFASAAGAPTYKPATTTPDSSAPVMIDSHAVDPTTVIEKLAAYSRRDATPPAADAGS